jgi:protein-L-isoaspartate(D-aspartate) O-methyltransferase
MGYDEPSMENVGSPPGSVNGVSLASPAYNGDGMKQLTEQQTRQDQMIRQQVMERGITTPRVIEALQTVPRDRFFPLEHQADAFADRAAPIGHGQTISQPYMVALMTDRLELQPEHRVLEIGTGSGYQTAVLARMCQQVYTVERVKPLLDEAWERLMDLGVRNVHFRYGDGTLGWTEAAPFDRLLIAAGAPRLPEQLLKTHLAEGGLAILPVGPDDEQMLVSVRRQGNQLLTQDIIPCRFVRLLGREGWSDAPEVQAD